jgi:hypothetical protein
LLAVVAAVLDIMVVEVVQVVLSIDQDLLLPQELIPLLLELVDLVFPVVLNLDQMEDLELIQHSQH